MSKTDVIAAQKAAMLQAQDAAVDSALSEVWDQSALEQKASDGTLSQADLDAAVAAAVEPLNAKIAQDALDLAAAHTEAEAQLAAITVQLDAMTAAKNADDSVIKGLQDSVVAVQAALDAIKAVVIP